MRDGEGGAAGIAAQRDLRQAVGDRHAELGVGRMQAGLGGAHVGALAHEIGGQAERQLARQAQRGQIEGCRRSLARKAPGKNGQEIALQGELLLQRRQQEPGLRDRRFLGHHIGQGDLPERVLLAQDLQQLRLQGDQPAGRRDLSAQRRFLDGGERDVGRERQVDGLALEGLVLCERLQRLRLPPHPAPNVGDIVDRHLRGMQAENLGVVGGRRVERRNRRPLARGVPIRRDLRKQGTALRQRVGLRDPHGGFGGLQVRVVLDRLLDQLVEGARAEQLPPAARNVGAIEERLAEHALVGIRTRKISRDRRRLRRQEIGPGRASRQNARSQNRCS